MSKSSHRVFVLEDDKMMRQSLQMLLDFTPELECCGTAGRGDEAFDNLEAADPELVLVDLSLPDTSGLDFVRRLNREYPDILTLVISGHDAGRLSEPALEAGARGFVQKGVAGKLREAILTVLRGEVYTSDAR